MTDFDTSYPPSLYRVTNPSTGATAGVPGTWTPSGSTPPATVAGIGAVVASPATAWTTGQYVQTGTAGAAGRASWSGTAWVGGAAPLSANESIANVKAYVNEHPDDAQSVLDVELANQCRTTLVTWLEEFIATHNGGTDNVTPEPIEPTEPTEPDDPDNPDE